MSSGNKLKTFQKTGFRYYRNIISLAIVILIMKAIYSITYNKNIIVLNQSEIDIFVSTSTPSLISNTNHFSSIVSNLPTITILDNVFTELEALEIINDAYSYHLAKLNTKVLSSINLLP